MGKAYRHQPERVSFQERNVLQSSLARSDSHLGTSLAEIELACPSNVLSIDFSSVAKFVFSYVVGSVKKLCLRGVECRKNLNAYL